MSDLPSALTCAAIVPSARLVVRRWRRYPGLVVCVGSLRAAWIWLSRIGSTGAWPISERDAAYLAILDELAFRLDHLSEEIARSPGSESQIREREIARCSAIFDWYAARFGSRVGS